MLEVERPGAGEGNQPLSPPPFQNPIDIVARIGSRHRPLGVRIAPEIPVVKIVELPVREHRDPLHNRVGIGGPRIPVVYQIGPRGIARRIAHAPLHRPEVGPRTVVKIDCGAGVVHIQVPVQTGASPGDQDILPGSACTQILPVHIGNHLSHVDAGLYVQIAVAVKIVELPGVDLNRGRVLDLQGRRC